MLYEIRNYHFKPELIEEYKAWAKNHAIPYLGSKMDVIGFWVNTADAPEVGGAPQDALGVANVTWIIKWRDLAQRQVDWPAAIKGPQWESVIANVPGGMTSYLRLESKFAEALI